MYLIFFWFFLFFFPKMFSVAWGSGSPQDLWCVNAGLYVACMFLWKQRSSVLVILASSFTQSRCYLRVKS